MNNPIMPAPHRILAITKETQHEYTYRIETEMKPQHGQFFQLSIPGTGEAPISVSSYGDGWMEFTIRSVGKVTSHIFSLHPGDELFLRGPYGKGWPIEELRGKHLVFVAGGTGVAPVRSLINKCFDEPDFAKSVNLICGFKNTESVLFQPDLDRWAKKFQTIYTLDNQEAPGWETGLVTTHLSKVPFADFGEDYAVIVVGPPIMMRFVGLELVKLKVPDEKIWVSFERKMSCAIGKCGHCRIDETYVCLEGPVFNYTVAKNLLD